MHADLPALSRLTEDVTAAMRAAEAAEPARATPWRRIAGFGGFLIALIVGATLAAFPGGHSASAAHDTGHAVVTACGASAVLVGGAAMAAPRAIGGGGSSPAAAVRWCR
jgi:cytochrome bd-type quinol oxidase subunit 2